MAEPNSTAPSPSNSAPSVPSVAQAALDEYNSRNAAAAPGAHAEGGEEGAEAHAGEGEGEPRVRKLSWNDALKQVPPDVRELMKSMQRDYTQKTQELSTQRKEFLREREALLKGQQALPKEQPALPEYDPFNEASINARIEAEVNKRLNMVLEPMKREYEVMAAEESYQSFLSKNPDFKTDKALRAEVQALLEASPSLDLETAYYAAKGKRGPLVQQAERAAAQARRTADREAATRGTALPRKGSGLPVAGDVKRMSNADILAMARALQRR
ncbi:hypothetical protein EBT31_20415 [bacterium]|jgi:hypothetical protein|nr:hypothetical protein [bacterium]